jgi:hypothetical protein
MRDFPNWRKCAQLEKSSHIIVSIPLPRGGRSVEHTGVCLPKRAFIVSQINLIKSPYGYVGWGGRPYVRLHTGRFGQGLAHDARSQSEFDT